MKTKLLAHLLALAVLAAMTNGCCTYLLVNSTHYTTQDIFVPSAVYQATNHATYALEGTRYNNVTEHDRDHASHIFVLLPKEKLTPANLRTNNSLSLAGIENLPADSIKGLKTKTQLPANYNLVTNLPSKNASFVLKEHHPRRVNYVFVPFTLAADVATSPFQLLVFGTFLLAIRGMGC